MSTDSKKLNIQILVGSTREKRLGFGISKWVEGVVRSYENIEVELVDLREYPLPFFDEDLPPSMNEGNYKESGAKIWSEKIKSADGYIIVTPEYNHGYPADLKNHLDYLYHEWGYKPVGFVSYGGHAGGSRAVEQLKQVALELHMVPVRDNVTISMVFTGLNEDGTPKDASYEKTLNKQIEQIVMLGNALRQVRN